jgi:type II secretory pathway pseudopilin PulG
MVVLVLVGIVAAVMLPEMKGTYEEAVLRSTSRELVSMFHQAYSRSVGQNQTHRVIIQESTGRYRLQRALPSFDSEPEFVPVSELAAGVGEVDHRITVRVRKSPGYDEAEESMPTLDRPATPPTAFDFYPDGTASGGTVVLRDRQGIGLTLRIHPVTARIQVSTSVAD